MDDFYGREGNKGKVRFFGKILSGVTSGERAVNSWA
jgi:hypothetical protein